jgi:hypothetical protein
MSKKQLSVKELWENHKIFVWASLEVIDDSEVAFVWNTMQYIPDGKKGTRCKDSWDFWKGDNSFTEKHMMWYDTDEEAMTEGIRQANKLIK